MNFDFNCVGHGTGSVFVSCQNISLGNSVYKKGKRKWGSNIPYGILKGLRITRFIVVIALWGPGLTSCWILRIKAESFQDYFVSIKVMYWIIEISYIQLCVWVYPMLSLLLMVRELLLYINIMIFRFTISKDPSFSLISFLCRNYRGNGSGSCCFWLWAGQRA